MHLDAPPLCGSPVDYISHEAKPPFPVVPRGGVVGEGRFRRGGAEASAIINRIQCRIVALDLRGHGETKVRNPEDLSAETMSKDVGNVVEALYGDLPPPIMLIGHSMGGAIAVHTAVANLVPSLLGLCMIDVVEGTAMDALNSMQNFLRSRPKTFKSLENAIEWRCEGAASPECPKAIVEGIIEEEEEEEEEEENEERGGSVIKRKKEDDTETKKEHLYTWRIELAKTEKYWDGWFRGLSNLFLSCPTPKLLLLAGVDRLDKDLTIGQMQGKFQMQVLPQCGHAVHEDAPDKVAEAVATFLIRHRFTEPIGGFQCLEEPFVLPSLACLHWVIYIDLSDGTMSVPPEKSCILRSRDWILAPKSRAGIPDTGLWHPKTQEPIQGSPS
ncbi:Protein phosphatase methylesterase 1 [Willisornis vidua]|uniref:protein phosphatase methylesterase-1 n=1 Tax=Willisornis vidua TaxID=1566151 RepID=A0ABQ9DNX2_9PASS|nr:Protein phosphatase methylesterase 1 [Willisornis vidua]